MQLLGLVWVPSSSFFSELERLRLNFFPQPDQAPTSTPIRSRSSISAKMFKRLAFVPSCAC